MEVGLAIAGFDWLRHKINLTPCPICKGSDRVLISTVELVRKAPTRLACPAKLDRRDLPKVIRAEPCDAPS
jgi:hypothetical protein